MTQTFHDLAAKCQTMDRRISRLEAILGVTSKTMDHSTEDAAPPHVDDRSARIEQVQQVATALPMDALRKVREGVRPNPPSQIPLHARETTRAIAEALKPADPRSSVSSLPLPQMADPVAREPADAQPVLAYEVPPTVEPPAQSDLEQTLGLKWVGWIGAIVVAIGAGLGIKFAYDQGLLELIPPAARLFLMSLGGFALLGAGEWVYRRINRIAAAALYGAGVATLFFVSHAGHAYYELYQPEVAFGLMALTTIIGAVVARRGGLVSIAVLSLIGGNLAPLVLQGEPDLVAFNAYLLMLQLVAVSLAWWGRTPKWWTLRGLSLTSTALWMLPQIQAATSPAITTAFLILYAAIYQLELFLSTLRHGDGDVARHGHDLMTGKALFSTLVTAAMSFGLLYLHRDAGGMVHGVMALAIAGACGVEALFVAAIARRGTLAADGAGVARSLRALALALTTQAAALVVLAVPLALDGANVVLGWSVMSIAIAALGVKLDSPDLRKAAAATWLLAMGQLLFWSITPGSNALDVFATVLGQPIAHSLFTGLLLTLAGHVVAVVLSFANDGAPVLKALEDSEPGLFPNVSPWVHALNAAAGVVCVVVLLAGLPTHLATAAIVVYAWMLAFADRGFQRLSPALLLQAGVLMALALAKWVIVDMLADRLTPGWSPMQYRPVLNPIMGLGFLIVGSMAALYWLRRQAWARWWTDPTQVSRQLAPTFIRGVVLLITFALSMEIDRVVERAAFTGALAFPAFQLKCLGWTMLWSTAVGIYTFVAARVNCAGATLIDESRAKRFESVLHTAAALSAVLAVKFVVVDTLAPRLLHGAALVSVGGNYQLLAGTFMVGLLTLIAVLAGREPRLARLQRMAGFVAMVLFVWTGSFEIDRFFELRGRSGAMPLSDARLARQVALSIFWSTFAVGSVVCGFRFRIATMRYVGLSVLGLTLVKVLIVDLSNAETGWRIVSCLVVGLLMLGTSVLYGKFSPKLLDEPGGG